MKSRTEDRKADFQCGGDWKSDIKPAGSTQFKSDKRFKLEVDNVTGKIKGDHDGKPIKDGSCEDDAATKKHRIKLQREDADNIYDYEGLITPVPASNKFKVLEGDGKRKTTPKKKPLAEEGESKSRGKKKQLPDDEWIAEKTT
jgi:hypothetical protein